MPNPAVPSSVIEKVRKCLNLAANAKTEAEATSAQKRAAEIITKYGISQHMLRTTEDQGDGCERHDILKGGSNSNPWFFPVCDIMRECFGAAIISYSRGSKITVICRPEDKEFAFFAWDELPRLFNRRLAHFRAEFLEMARAKNRAAGYPDDLIERHIEQKLAPQVRAPRFSKSYFHGLSVGFRQAWAEAQAQALNEARAENAGASESYAIVLSGREEALCAAEKRFFPESKFRQSRTNLYDAIHAAGVKHGRELKLARALPPATV